jgi:HEAT repeat protein
MIDSADPQMRMRALEGWATVGGIEAYRGALRGLEDREDAVRAAALEAFRRLLGAKLSPEDAKALGDTVLTKIMTRPTMSEETRQALHELRPVIGAVVLERFQSDKEPPEARSRAALALGLLGCREAEQALAENARAANAAFAESCAQALYELHDPDTAPVWAGLCKHRSKRIRAMAVDALVDLGGPQAFKPLYDIAVRKIYLEAPLQRRAFAGLVQWPDDTMVLPALLDVLERNSLLRPDAARELQRRTGVNLGDSAAAWRGALQGEPAPAGPQP